MERYENTGDFGKRMYSEIVRLFPTMTAAAEELGCTYHAIWTWYAGTSPSAHFLARLVELGGDVMFVLTGKRCEDDRYCKAD